MVKSLTQTLMLACALWLTASRFDGTELAAMVLVFLVLLAFNVADEGRFFGLLNVGPRMMYAGLGIVAALLTMVVLLGPTEAVSWVDHAIAQVGGNR